LFIVAATVLWAAGTTACGDDKPPPIGVPVKGIYFGAKAGPNESDVSALEQLLASKLAVRAIFASWDEQWPDERVLADHRSGRLSLVTWMGTDLASIASGRYDPLIRARARAVRALGFPIFLRPMHEMNGTWYPWCCDPENYRAAWRRIHSIFEDEGADNVAWVWSPTASVGGWRDYYPGDDYVDWIGASVYNWGSTREPRTWRPLAQILGPFYADFRDEDKPIMLAEVGSVEQGGDKGAWVVAGSMALKAGFPAVKAWIHQEYRNGDADWRVESSDRSLVAYRRMTLDPYFRAFGAN
jgi:hypothetical protein